MKVFDVAGRVQGSGEHVLGYDETGSHACYLIYGVIPAGEKGRELKPGRGHEEMVLVVNGELILMGQFTGRLRQGQAIHLRDEESCSAGNEGPEVAVYVIAGGHSASGHGP